MSLQTSSEIESLFHDCLNNVNPIMKEVWTSDISTEGIKRLIKKPIIDVGQCFGLIKRNKEYSSLENEFEKLGISDDMMLENFTKTYLYLLQDTSFDKTSFDKTLFDKTWKIMNQILDDPNKFYFFVPMYNFDSDYTDITLGEFKIKKITPFHFDKITDINLEKSDDEPFVRTVEKKLKYVLEFSGLGNPTIDPKAMYNSFQNALRITDNGPVIFGNHISYNPDGWQQRFAPGIRDSVILSYDEYFLKEDKISKLKENLKLLKQLDEKSDSIRYLGYSIRRFNYVYQNEVVEDNITDLMISLETLLNFEPYEVRDKTSLRAAVLLESDGNEKLNCRKFIKKCYDIRSEIVHGKKRKAKIMKNNIQLTDAEIQIDLINYVRTAIVKMLHLHFEYGSQSNVLDKIDEYTLDQTSNLL